MQWLLAMVQADPSHYVRLVSGSRRGLRAARISALSDSKPIGSEKLAFLRAKVCCFCPIRHKILSMLCKNPPFTKASDSSLCNEALVDQLWKLMNSGEMNPHDLYFFFCTNEPNIGCFRSKRAVRTSCLALGPILNVIVSLSLSLKPVIFGNNDFRQV